MLNKMAFMLLNNEIGWIVVFIIIGFVFSFFLKKLKEMVKKTPNKIDDALFSFIVNDIFLKVEKNKIDNYIKIFSPNFKNLDKLKKAVIIFKEVYKAQTGEIADESIINKAKAVWSELAIVLPSSKKTK